MLTPSKRVNERDSFAINIISSLHTLTSFNKHRSNMIHVLLLIFRHTYSGIGEESVELNEGNYIFFLFHARLQSSQRDFFELDSSYVRRELKVQMKFLFFITLSLRCVLLLHPYEFSYTKLNSLSSSRLRLVNSMM